MPNIFMQKSVLDHAWAIAYENFCLERRMEGPMPGQSSFFAYFPIFLLLPNFNRMGHRIPQHASMIVVSISKDVINQAWSITHWPFCLKSCIFTLISSKTLFLGLRDTCLFQWLRTPWYTDECERKFNNGFGIAISIPWWTCAQVVVSTQHHIHNNNRRSK